MFIYVCTVLFIDFTKYILSSTPIEKFGEKMIQRWAWWVRSVIPKLKRLR
jgi:hypothetical protein